MAICKASSTVIGLCFLLNFAKIAGIIITVPPVDTQGLLNTVLIFCCQGQGDLLNWTVNGTLIKDIKQERGIEINTTNLKNELISELRIVAKPINDNIHIRCNIISLDPFDLVFKGAILQVLGISPVTNLQLNISEYLLNTSIITWDPPSFSSDDDYHYNIIIEVNNEYILVDVTTQDLEYILEIEPCFMYNISVSAVSVSYSSTPEMIQYFYGRNEFQFQNKRIIFEDDNRCNVSIELKMYTEFPKLCSGTIIATSNNPFQPDLVDTRSYKYEGFDVDSMKHKFTTGYFDSRQEEVLTIEFMDDFNMNPVISQTVTFTTFHVQDLKVFDLSNGLVSVTCVFAEGSLADGCLVIFINEHNESWEHVINKTSGEENVTEYITIPNDIYHTVNVYDIVNGKPCDMISKTVQFEVIVNISFIYTTASSTVETSRTSSQMISTHSTATTFTSTSIITSNSPTSTPNNSSTITIPIVIGITAVVLIIIVSLLLVIILFWRRSLKKQSVVFRQGIMGVRKPQAESPYSDLIPLTMNTRIINETQLNSNDEENPYFTTRDQLLSNRSPVDSLLHGSDLRPSITSQESTTSEAPLLQPHSPRTLTSLPEHADDDVTVIPSVNNQDSSETSNSNDTPPSTSEESLKFVEVSNDPHVVTTSIPDPTPSVVVQSDTSKNRNYYINVPPHLQKQNGSSQSTPLNTSPLVKCIRVCDESPNPSESIQEDLPPPYCDLVSDNETSTECSGYTGTNVFSPTHMHVHGPIVAGNSIFNSHDTHNDYDTDPHLASSQEEMNIIITRENDYVSTETKVQGDRQVYTTIQQLSPEPQEDNIILRFSNTQDNPQSPVPVQPRNDLLEVEEENLSDTCQEVDRSSNGQLVITSSIKSSLVCKSSEQVKKEKDVEPKLVCFGHLDQAKEIAETTFFNLFTLEGVADINFATILGKLCNFTCKTFCYILTGNPKPYINKLYMYLIG